MAIIISSTHSHRFNLSKTHCIIGLPSNGSITLPGNLVDPILPWRTAVIFFCSSSCVKRPMLLSSYPCTAVKKFDPWYKDFWFYEPSCPVNQAPFVSQCYFLEVVQQRRPKSVPRCTHSHLALLRVILRVIDDKYVGIITKNLLGKCLVCNFLATLRL